MAGEVEEQDKYSGTMEKQRKDVLVFRLTTSVGDVKNGNVFDHFETLTNFHPLQGSS